MQEQVVVESDNNELIIQSTPLMKLKNIAMALMFFMISLGQWNDTKDVIVASYEEVVSRFTNQIEYEQIQRLRIGFTEEYVKKLVGSPQVIKPSKSDKNLQYYYYDSEKYLLITFIKKSRLVGFSIVAKQDDFLAPIVYLKKDLNNGSLASYLPSQDAFETNTGSLEYFSETYEFSNNLMFYNFALGYVNYSKTDSIYTSDLIKLNNKLNTGEDVLLSKVSFSTPIKPNFYSVTELSHSEFIFEALLSNYEMNSLFSDES